MKAPNITAGEWIIAQNNGPKFVAALTDRTGRICTMHEDNSDMRVVNANARAIAALPQCLAALEKLHRYHSDPQHREAMECAANIATGGECSHLEALVENAHTALLAVGFTE